MWKFTNPAQKSGNFRRRVFRITCMAKENAKRPRQPKMKLYSRDFCVNPLKTRIDVYTIPAGISINLASTSYNLNSMRLITIFPNANRANRLSLRPRRYAIASIDANARYPPLLGKKYTNVQARYPIPRVLA